METNGEYRVGLAFNPGQFPQVWDIKRVVSQEIDRLQHIVDAGGEAGRCAAIAQTKFEEAAMWAVKAVTKPPRSEG